MRAAYVGTTRLATGICGLRELSRHPDQRYWPGQSSQETDPPRCRTSGMSASVIVLAAPGVQPSGASAATRRAWFAVAWFSSVTASRAFPDGRPPSARARTAAALALAEVV